MKKQEQRSESNIGAVMFSSVQNLLCTSMQRRTLTSHFMPNRTEGTARCFSTAAAHQVEVSEWIWAWNTVTVVCFVYDYNFFYSTSQLHMAHCKFSISPAYCSVWHYPLLLALLAPTQDRSGAKKQCLETMLARWKEQVKWEKRREKKRLKKEWYFFFCSYPRLFNFIWDYWAWGA